MYFLTRFRETQLKLSNLLFGLLLIGLIFLGLYILWRWCSDEDKDKDSKSKKDKLNMQAVYAHEIEPGLVVLQSEDGEYFRILREYDSSKRNTYGALTEQETSQIRINDSGSYLAPALNVARVQVHAPQATAPPLMALSENSSPPSYEHVKLDVRTY